MNCGGGRSDEQTTLATGHVPCFFSRVMLPPYIIEELRRRDRARREEQSRPQPELELEVPMAPPPQAPSAPTEPERGVAIIDVL